MATDDRDVLIVGAGPAGARLAADLAAAGLRVTLIDRLRDLRSIAFSSAAVPLATLSRYRIPQAVVAASWSGWHLVGPGPRERHWEADGPLGAVLDFGRLRCWLADQAQGHGAELLLGTRALAWHQQSSGISLTVATPSGEQRTLSAGWLVDATGSRRQLIGTSQVPSPEPLVSGLGVEWLISVQQPVWQQWSNQLAFFLGSDWVPQGYGWIFPMEAPRLKVGICRLDDDGTAQTPLSVLLAHLLERRGLADAEVMDRHGGRISSTIHRRELHRDGRLLGVGDAVSTANLLGGEGIRHALLSATVLAPLLIRAVRQGRDGDRRITLARFGSDPLRPYVAQLRRHLGWRWPLSGRLARRTWLGLKDPGADRRLERLLNGLERQSAETLSALLFDYRFERYGLRALPDLLGLR